MLDKKKYFHPLAALFMYWQSEIVSLDEICYEKLNYSENVESANISCKTAQILF